MSNFEIALSVIVFILFVIFCIQQYCIVLLSEFYNKEVENSNFWRNATFYYLNKPTNERKD